MEQLSSTETTTSTTVSAAAAAVATVSAAAAKKWTLMDSPTMQPLYPPDSSLSVAFYAGQYDKVLIMYRELARRPSIKETLQFMYSQFIINTPSATRDVCNRFLTTLAQTSVDDGATESDCHEAMLMHVDICFEMNDIPRATHFLNIIRRTTFTGMTDMQLALYQLYDGRLLHQDPRDVDPTVLKELYDDHRNLFEVIFDLGPSHWISINHRVNYALYILNASRRKNETDAATARQECLAIMRDIYQLVRTTNNKTDYITQYVERNYANVIALTLSPTSPASPTTAASPHHSC